MQFYGINSEFIRLLSPLLGVLALSASAPPALAGDDLSHKIPWQADAEDLIDALDLPIKTPTPETLHQAAAGLLRGADADQRISLISKNPKFSFGLSAAHVAELFTFEVNGINVCDLQIKAVPVLRQKPILLGTIPALDSRDIAQPEDWDLAEDAFAAAKHDQFNAANANALTLISAEKCYLNHDDTLIPVWDLIIDVGGLSYRALANAATVYRFEPRFFDVDGKSKIYAQNSSDAALSEFTLKGLTGDGSLTTSNLYTAFDSTKYTRANDSDLTFYYDPGTSQFAETSIFTNATRTFEWFQKVGFTNFGAKPIKLVVHAVLGGNGNNALYTPSPGGTGNPTIFIGDGDGVLLQNLSTDADVVGHEFGHHVIYTTVTRVSGESLVIHEGLADFFTFARTGNSCLGESICPKGSAINCAVPAQCLRSADNQFKFGGSDLPNEEHFRSQFISGMLWDMREKDDIPSSELTSIVLTSISYLVSDSGYKHLVIALLTADRNLFEGEHCSKILARAISRGLKNQVSDVSCDADLPTITTSNSSNPASTSPQVTSKSEKGGLCGTISGLSDKHLATSIVLALLPLALLWRHRRHF